MIFTRHGSGRSTRSPSAWRSLSGRAGAEGSSADDGRGATITPISRTRPDVARSSATASTPSAPWRGENPIRIVGPGADGIQVATTLDFRREGQEGTTLLKLSRFASA